MLAGGSVKTHLEGIRHQAYAQPKQPSQHSPICRLDVSALDLYVTVVHHCHRRAHLYAPWPRCWLRHSGAASWRPPDLAHCYDVHMLMQAEVGQHAIAAPALSPIACSTPDAQRPAGFRRRERRSANFRAGSRRRDARRPPPRQILTLNGLQQLAQNGSTKRHKGGLSAAVKSLALKC